jgi:hypothetical protein
MDPDVERELAEKSKLLVQSLAQKALEKTAYPERTLAASFAGDEIYEHLRVSVGDVGDATRSLDDIRVALKRFEPELWAAFMRRAIEGGRNAQGAERAVLAALYGWGVTREETDQESVERMKRAMAMMEESQALTEEQLFEASCKMVGRYLTRHHDAWAILNRYLPVVAEADGAER